MENTNMPFKDYKKNRAESFAKILEENEKINTNENNFESDPDDWYPGRDKAGNGSAVIRFLPPIESEEVPFVKWFSHNFQYGPTGKWYIENSSKTFGEKNVDPVAEYNKKLWNSTTDENHPNRKQASAQKRKLNFRSNIYVVSDPINPENNGKIKKFKFGKTFYDFINLAMNPPNVEGADDNELPLNPFDLIEGANFKIKTFTEVKGTKSYPNYSKSTWAERGPLGPEKVMETVYDELQSNPKWSLKAYIAPEMFKPYHVLKKHLDDVLGFDFNTGALVGSASDVQSEDKPSSLNPRTASAPVKKSTPSPQDGEDSDEDFFKSLIDSDE
jgi:hypothetical protein